MRVCDHFNAKESKLGLICVDCGKKLKGKLKPVKKHWRDTIKVDPFHSEKNCFCKCHNHGHAFCIHCRNIHRVCSDANTVHDPLMKAKLNNSIPRKVTHAKYANRPFVFRRKRDHVTDKKHINRKAGDVR